MIYKSAPENFEPRFEIVACFCEKEGRILLLHRHIHKPQGGTWGLPAGKIELNESVEDAMLRELEEETGFVVDFEELRYVNKLYVKSTEYDFICHLYGLISISFPEVVLHTEEHQNFVWVSPGEAFSLPLIEDLDVWIREYYGVMESV